MANEEIVKNNGEILFIYDAETCNPNGDPDNENKPRMDYDTGINIVTDVRLKRYIRDFIEKYKNLDLYLTNSEGIVLNATDRLKFWIWRKNNPDKDVDMSSVKNKKNKAIAAELKKVTREEILDAFIDVRLFGATMPIKGSTEKDSGSSITFTGPIQFNWGKSFNQVELMDTFGITTHLSSGEGSQGSMGTDYRLYYSLIGFHGIISAKRASITKLSKRDLEIFDEAIIKSIPLLATRSKIGQAPRFYIRLEYNTDDYHIGDLRRYVKLKESNNLRKISDVNINFNDLYDLLSKHEDKIKSIHIWTSNELMHTLQDFPLKSKIIQLNY